MSASQLTTFFNIVIILICIFQLPSPLVCLQRKVVSERRVADVIRSLVNPRGLQLQSARVLHETLLVLMYGSETMIWKEKERFRIRDVHRFAGY